MIILSLLIPIILIDLVDSLDSAYLFPMTLEGELGFQPWKMHFNFDIVLLNSTLILSANFHCLQALNVFW